MPDLNHTLQGHDLGFLKIIADAWGLEMNAPDAHSAMQTLHAALRDPDLVIETIQSLPQPALQALQALMESEGRMSWAHFSRRFGDVRVMGAARRDRERPDLNPDSPAEILWYRALIGRAFLSLAPEAQEMAYIPDEFIPLMPSFGSSGEPTFGRPATPGESAHPILVNSLILDHACTFLAALRVNLPPLGWHGSGENLTEQAMHALLSTTGLLQPDGQLKPDEVRAFLEAPRANALSQLVSAWMSSESFNELFLLPGLTAEGNWRNDPRQTRETILGWISRLPVGAWWSLSAFVNTIREHHPDFQRPAGDYDSWFLKQDNTGDFLRGFASWDLVDGALIRFIITGPMHWLGLLDLAAPTPQAPIGAFRLSSWAEALWHGQAPQGLPRESTVMHVNSDGSLRLPALTPRAVRYQVARFCDWLEPVNDEFRYQISPHSLERARQQGLKINHLVNLLKRHGAAPLSPSLIKALEGWDQNGTLATLDEITLLRVKSPEILAALRKTRAARYLGETISPTVVEVKKGGREIVTRALVEIGYLVD